MSFMKRSTTLLLAFLLWMPGLATVPAAADETAGKFAIPATDDGLPGAGPIRRYDWFRNLWQAKRSGWAKQVERDQNAVVFLGDSITQGWGDTMSGSFGDLKVANRGISGDTTR
ncbi:MAG: G-D-S-L family lipolytic protein, partial [Planctomycetales bacterium]|nr:G-D-S-L family lipolytic protein [Planctomycetales bacterium]